MMMSLLNSLKTRQHKMYVVDHAYEETPVKCLIQEQPFSIQGGVGRGGEYKRSGASVHQHTACHTLKFMNKIRNFIVCIF